MRIRRLEAWPVEMPLTEPRRIARETVRATTSVFVMVETDAGVHGFGCATPGAAGSVETPAGCLLDLMEVAGPVLEGRDPTRLAPLVEDLEKALPTSPAARAGVDIALLDLLAKLAGFPLWKLLGGRRDRIRTSAVVGALAPREAAAMARRRIDEGFSMLKIEGGGDVDEDVARVLAIRKAVGPEVELRFDANQGYDVEESVRFGAAVRDAALELFEQPTPRRNAAWLGRVNRRVELPVMADESLSGRDDALELVAGDRVDHFNVKLQKVGGITEAARIAAVARSAGLGIMIGCGSEATLGIAAGLAFALGTSGVLYAELDGHLGLAGDPSAGLLRLERGVLHPAPGPGLGWSRAALRAASG